MFIIDFNSNSRSAFWHGFVKGLAAPVCLYHSEALPAIKVEYVKPSVAPSAKDALALDWRHVGQDLRGVIDEQERKQAASKAR